MLVVLSLLLFWHFPQSLTQELCNSRIFCQGELLHAVQMARIFNDSSTFVHLKLAKNESKILEKFQTLLKSYNNKPSKEKITAFVKDNFENYTEFDNWTPPDFQKNPKFLKKIRNKEMRKFAQNLIAIWPKLGRKVKDEVFKTPELFSLIPPKNGFIIPGGRFNEFYYWDTYWIVKGLLVCEMHETVRGIIENFFTLIEKFGFIPNAPRVYFLNRSQPPLLTYMVADYMAATNNTRWLKSHIKTIDKELRFWLANRVTIVEKDGVKYTLARYSTSESTPRPESYYEDVTTAAIFDSKSDKRHLYANLKAAAESGWDFSSRWIVDQDGGNNANLSFVNTERIIPVDLNAFLSGAFRLLAKLYKTIGDRPNADWWWNQAIIWRTAIKQVLYDDKDGVWYDFDKQLSKPRRYFYPSNLSPLWCKAYKTSQGTDLARRAVKYLLEHKIKSFEGGIPTSLIRSGQQWDLPNAWPPLQHVAILGLERSGDKEVKQVAKQFAKRWVKSNLIGFYKSGKMFEKYDAEHPGQAGGGGEYNVQEGFGWTNGVVLDLVNLYYT